MLSRYNEYQVPIQIIGTFNPFWYEVPPYVSEMYSADMGVLRSNQKMELP